jgi:hypothetical protein
LLATATTAWADEDPAAQAKLEKSRVKFGHVQILGQSEPATDLSNRATRKAARQQEIFQQPSAPRIGEMDHPTVAQTQYQSSATACDGCGAPACGAETACGAKTACGCDRPCGNRQLARGQLGRFRPPSNLTLRGEYLHWWTDGFDIPPLLTTSAAGTSADNAGVLGLGITRVVYGNQNLLDGARSGGRFTLNYWLDPQQTSGVEAIYTGLENQRWTFTADNQQFPILARPFFNVESGVADQDAELISYPGVIEGNARIEAESRLQGVEVLFRNAISRDCGIRLDYLIGWRHNRLDESLRFSDFKRVLSNDLGLTIGTTLEEADRFRTENRFNGAELGIAAQTCRCGWSIAGVMKLAVGNNHSTVGIDGDAVFIVPGGQPPITTTPAGLLAQGTNIGVFESDDFAVIPELGITLGYDLNQSWRATLGYTFMYWSRVARPGDQIDTELNLTQLDPPGLVGLARPSRTGELTDFWAQGLRLGLEARF